MKPPICKLCKSPHWTYEKHRGSETEVPGYVKDMVGGVLGREGSTAEAVLAVRPMPDTAAHRGSSAVEPPRSNVPTTPVVPTDVPTTCGCGKPREGRYKSCSACRKRAYRERSR